MVRVLEVEPIAVYPDATGKVLAEIAGLSTDEKPVNATYATGSTFLEIDTSDVYFWDEVSMTWKKAGGSNG